MRDIGKKKLKSNFPSYDRYGKPFKSEWLRTDDKSVRDNVRQYNKFIQDRIIIYIKYSSDLNLCDIVLRRGQIFHPQRIEYR